MRLERINYNGGYLWVAKKSPVPLGEQFYFDSFDKHTGVYTNVYSDTVPSDSYCASGFGYCYKPQCYKIIAQTNLNLQNIPHVEIGEEDNIEALGVKFLINNGWEHLSVRGSIPEKPYPTSFVADLTRWCEGYYKAALAERKYSEEDMVNFSQYLIEMPNVLLENKTLKEHLKHFDELKQIADEIEIEVEWVSDECIKSNCAETDSFKGTEHEGISMCDDGCVRAMPRMVSYKKEEEII